MKERPVLYIAILLTLMLEVVLMALVYQKVGGERLPSQLFRFSVQIILSVWALGGKSKTALFLLAAYHILPTIIYSGSMTSSHPFKEVQFVYHIAIGIIIYFHDWIESKL